MGWNAAQRLSVASDSFQPDIFEFHGGRVGDVKSEHTRAWGARVRVFHPAELMAVQPMNELPADRNHRSRVPLGVGRRSLLKILIE